MNSILYQRWWTWRRVFSIGVLCATVLFILFVAPRAFAAKPAMLQNGERLLTVYDRGIEQSFVTKAATVEAALKEAGLTLEPTDRVEPGRDEQLVADSYTINIYRARPVIVVDGSLRKTILTASQSPDQIAKDAGLVLYPEDTTVMAQSQNVISAGAPLEFRITRAKVVELTLYGDTIKLRTQAKTVQDMLRDKNIKLGDSDRISLPLETPIIDGLQLRVWREGKQTLTQDEDVNFQTDTIKDANRPVNYKEVKTPGVKGKRSVTYEIVVQDGKEVARREISSVTVSPAQNQVEIVGTKPEYMQYTGGGTKSQWLAASGISQEDWGYADWLVQKESGWNPNSRNVSSGACGLAQALPCSKVPGNPLDPVNSLNWMNGYVKGRYGSWANAVSHSKSKGWY